MAITKEQRDKERFEQKLAENQAVCDMIAACSGSQRKTRRKMTTHVYDKDPHHGWSKLAVMTGALKNDPERIYKGNYNITVLSRTEIEKGDLLLPMSSPIFGVVSVDDYREVARGDWSDHKYKAPHWYSLTVRVVPVAKAAELDPGTFTQMAQAEADRKKRSDEAKKENAARSKKKRK